MKVTQFKVAYPSVAVFEGEEEGGGEQAKTFTQEEVNKFLAAEKRKQSDQINKHKTQAAKALEELNSLKGKTTLTGDERTEFETRLEQMSNELLTKEELAAKQAKKNAEKHGKEVESLTGERDYWRSQYTESTINRDLLDAAATNDAYNPNQIVRLLNRQAQLVEGLDDTGKPNGQFTTKVKFDDVDKDGNPVQLDLTPKETLKRMREMDEYQNLFKGEGTGGLGKTNKGNSKTPDIKELAKDPIKYRAYREKHGL